MDACLESLKLTFVSRPLGSLAQGLRLAGVYRGRWTLMRSSVR